MTDAYRKLSPGDVLKSFPSSSWNDLLDMARDWKATRNAITSKTAGLGLESARTLVPIKNATGSDVDRYGVLALSDFLISPSAHLQNFKNRPAFEGDTPAATMAEKFVVLQEPIGSGKIGLGLLAGVTAVQIDVTQAHHCFADTVPGDATKLRSCLWGPVEILVYVKDAQDNRPIPSAFIWLNKHKAGEAKGRYVTDSLGMAKISLAEKLKAVTIISLGYHHAKIGRVFRGNNNGKWTLTVYMIPVQASFPNEIFYPRKKK